MKLIVWLIVAFSVGAPIAATQGWTPILQKPKDYRHHVVDAIDTLTAW